MICLTITNSLSLLFCESFTKIEALHTKHNLHLVRMKTNLVCSLIFLPFSSFFYHFNFIVASFRAFPSILWTFDLFHGIRFNRGILNMFLTFFSLTKSKLKTKFIEQNCAKTQKYCI